MLPALENTSTEVKLNALLALYSSGDKSHIEYHDVDKDKVGAAQMFTEELMDELLVGYKKIRRPRKIIDNTVSITGVVPKNVYYFESDKRSCKTIFYEKRQERELLFTDESNELESGKYMVPGIVYFYNNKSLSIFAYSQWRDGNTKLYDISLPNVDGSGSVCMGNVKREILTNLHDIIAQTTESFWSSYFREWRYNNYKSREAMWKENNYKFSNELFLGKLKDVASKTLSPKFDVT